MNLKPLFLFSLSLSLIACGGGGSDGETSPSAEESSSGAVESSPDQPVDDTDLTGGGTGACELTEMQAQMLVSLNQARSQARDCGDERHPTAPALTYSCEIAPAALAHSIDMATNNFFSHTGSDGLKASQRVDATGYQWRVVGENIAAGYHDVDSVMAGWLESPGHCRNIMDPRFEEVAVERVLAENADYSSYWTQVFATPR
ncbi:MAG: CAP domain-containing protein [Pseudomonadales bacterium]|nr:CAP domain-containing protein [Pseudomonadales bacterium]